METPNKYVAFFDLDGTILNASSGMLMVKYLRKHGLLTPRIRAGLAAARFTSTVGASPHVSMSALIWFAWKGKSAAASAARDRAIFHEYVASAIRQDAVREISIHKERGGSSVLLSASVDTICDCVAQHLSMDDVICTKPQILDGRYTGRIEGRYCYGEEKRVQATAYAEARGISIDDCWYYGDAAADRFVLEAVGHPVCVQPDATLRAIAKEKGWQVAEW